MSNDYKLIGDFLSLSMNQMRSSIRGIDESYSNFWDILAELVQNSVDAIIRRKVETGKIDLFIDCQRGFVSINDNGTGIDPDKLANLLKPFSTDKFGDPNSIGEKGVGLKFAYFQSSDFTIKTYHDNGAAEAHISNARFWKLQDDESTLDLEFRELDNNQPVGTFIELQGIENEALFSLTFDQLKYILRTKTAVGNTDVIWDAKQDININLIMIDINGKRNEEQIPYKYLLLTEIYNSNDCVLLDDFKAWVAEKDHTDLEKRNKLKNKIIISNKTIDHNGRTIHCWSCFVPSRDVWNDASLKSRLASNQQLNDNNWLNEKNFVLFQPGIYTAVKGMPTGINIDPPSTGTAGYWSNIFILFQDDSLKFDIGRKTIHGKIANIYRTYAKSIFSEFTNIVGKYVAGTPISTSQWNKEEIIDEIKSLTDLNSDKVNFLKSPKNQEASVAAIFYELIGSKCIDDIEPLISGYRNKYDLYAKWNNRTVIIEFKSHLRNIVRDFNDAQKIFNEMNYIVCWEVTDEDIQAMSDLSIMVEELIPSSLTDSNNEYINCSTHRMILSAPVTPVYIIDLKKFISQI